MQFEFALLLVQKLHLPIGQVIDQIHEPDWKLHQP